MVGGRFGADYKARLDAANRRKAHKAQIAKTTNLLNNMISKSPPKATSINANLRGANFMRGGGAVEAGKYLIDWENLKGAAKEPLSALKGAGKVALMTQYPALGMQALGPKGALSTMLMTDPDVQKASAVGGIIPMGTIERLGMRGGMSAVHAFEPSFMRGIQEFDDIENIIDTLSREARQAGKGSAPKIQETPRSVSAFTPSKKDAEGFWEPVERPAIDDISGLPSYDPSEIRSAAFGGVGELVKGTPLESLTDLAVPNKATTIRAIYKPPTAEEILSMMRKTDRAVPSRLKAKRDRLVTQIDEAEDVDTALRLRAELDATTDPKKWKFNEYTLKDAEALRDRWIMASQHFEDTYGVPLPWRLEADYFDEAGNLKTTRIFGQDVEHKVPVNQGGKGTIDELTLLPTIPNTSKRDYSWDDYAAKHPDDWISLIEILYGSGTRH